MKDVCVMPEGCVFRECELKGVVERYLGEKCKVVCCPDKEKSYTNQANRGPEIDLILESKSEKRIAVEVKSIKLENKPFMRDVYLVLDTISRIANKNLLKDLELHFIIKKSLKAVKKLLDEYFTNLSANYPSFSNKYIEISLKPKSDKNWDEPISTNTEPSTGKRHKAARKGQKNNTDYIIFKCIIFKINDIITYCHLPENGKYTVSKVIYNYEQITKDINKHIETDSPAFKIHMGVHERIMLFDVELSTITRDILDNERGGILKDRILSVWEQLKLEHTNNIDTALLSCRFNEEAKLLVFPLVSE